MGVSKVYYIKDFFIRLDDEVGLLIYNRSNGFTYAYSYLVMDESTRKNIIEGNNAETIIEDLISELQFDNDRLLPSKEYWHGGPQQKLEFPITINWLITNLCTHKCYYCYAEDIIGNSEIKINNDVKRIADNILTFRPLNVVLSGGEPLLNSNIIEIVEYLSNKTGITIDTNGHCFERMRELLPLIIKNNVHVRVSLDTIRVKEMYKTRPVVKKEFSEVECMRRVFSTIEMLIENRVNFTIQTVLTKSNANDLESMGDKLCKMGVKVWRVFELQINDSISEKCNKLIFDKEVDHTIRKNTFFKKKLIKRSDSYWEGMVVVFTPAKGDKNNVILVLPDGTFYTQPKHSNVKAVIDEERPYLPSRKAIRNLNWGDHFERYIE